MCYSMHVHYLVYQNNCNCKKPNCFQMYFSEILVMLIVRNWVLYLLVGRFGILPLEECTLLTITTERHNSQTHVSLPTCI